MTQDHLDDNDNESSREELDGDEDGNEKDGADDFIRRLDGRD